jgi:hypothetical protein
MTSQLLGISRLQQGGLLVQQLLLVRTVDEQALVVNRVVVVEVAVIRSGMLLVKDERRRCNVSCSCCRRGRARRDARNAKRGPRRHENLLLKLTQYKRRRNIKTS